MTLNGPLLLMDSNTLAALAKAWRRESILGLDTESNGMYAYYPSICLIQLSTPKHDYLIDPLIIDDLSPLGDLLADPTIEVIFHAAEQDIAGLKREFGFEVTNLFDTMVAAQILGFEQVGLSKLLHYYFGVEQDKRYQRANWGKRPLSPAQQRYAQLDTHYLIELRNIIRAELEKCNALEEAEEIFAALCATAPLEPHQFDPDGFWRIPKKRHFTLRQMACLRELYLWRERVARKRNIPPFKVLQDDRMIKIVQANPKTVEELRKLLTEAQTRRYSKSIIKALKQGHKAPLPKRPRQRPPEAGVRSRHSRLRDWRKHRARERGVNSDIIMPKDLLWQIAKEAPESMQDLEAIDALGPWRRAQYGSEILQVLQRTP